MKFSPKKSDFVFVALVVAVIVFVALLPSPKDNNPPMPNNLVHHGLKLDKDCFRCHRQGV